MAGHLLLVIHREDQEIGTLMRPFQETEERPDGAWDYWGFWGAVHPGELLGREWNGSLQDDETLTEWLRREEEDIPPPILIPSGQWIEAPHCFSEAEWRNLFWQIVAKYPGDRCCLIRYHT